MSNSNGTYEKLTKELREIATLGSIAAVVGWDEQVMLRPGGTEFRASQSALLARMLHERFTAKQIGDWLGELESSDLNKDKQTDAAVVLRELRKDYDRATKLPTRLVEEIAHTATLGHHAWVEARQKKDYPHFAPWLRKMLDLKREQAKCLMSGTDKTHPYDALLDEYEPGETTESLTRLFDAMKPRLVSLIGRIQESGKKAPADILERHFPKEAQEKLARQAAEAVGFDADAGRLDVSVHPFCTGIAPGDTRITTRYDEKFFGDAFFGTLHETGHAMYEQGLPKQTHLGTALAEACGLGIHESQSRLWENLVGRSRAFWKCFMPQVRQAFPDALAGVSDDDWMWAINDVRPSYIRTESDEATYNLHILLRFELEPRLLTGDIAVNDVPRIWNERFKSYLGLDVPNDAMGCLQDVHWSGGGIGYFPTYTLGNMYAAQFFQQAKKDLIDLDLQLERGEFAPLLAWLRSNIHRHGRRYSGREMVKRVTGEDLSPRPMLDYLEAKAAEYYGV